MLYIPRPKDYSQYPWWQRIYLRLQALWWEWKHGLVTLGICEMCEVQEGWCLRIVHLTDSCTMYHPKPGQTMEEANPPLWLCKPCQEEHHEYWRDMWANVPF